MAELQLENNPDKRNRSKIGKHIAKGLVVFALGVAVKFGIIDHITSSITSNQNTYSLDGTQGYVDPGVELNSPEAPAQFTEPLIQGEVPKTEGFTHQPQENIQPEGYGLSDAPHITTEGFDFSPENQQVIWAIKTDTFHPDIRVHPGINELIEYLEVVYENPYVFVPDSNHHAMHEIPGNMMLETEIPISIAPFISSDLTQAFDIGEKNLYEVGLLEWERGNTLVMREYARLYIDDLAMEYYADPYNQELKTDYFNLLNVYQASEQIYQSAFELVHFLTFINFQFKRGLPLDQFMNFMQTPQGVEVMDEVGSVFKLDSEDTRTYIEWLLGELRAPTMHLMDTHRTTLLFEEARTNIPTRPEIEETYFYFINALRDFLGMGSLNSSLTILLENSIPFGKDIIVGGHTS